MIQKLTFKYAIIVSLVIGLFLTLYFGITGFSYYEVYKNSKPVYGRIEEINYQDKSTMISYSDEKSTITSKISFIDSRYKVGDITTVYYDINNSTKAFVYEQALTLLVFFGIGIFFILLAFILIIIVIKKSKPKKKKKLVK